MNIFTHATQQIPGLLDLATKIAALAPLFGWAARVTKSRITARAARRPHITGFAWGGTA